MNDREKVEDLFAQFARTRQRSVRNELVESHMGFAYHVVRRFEGRGVPTEDLRQVALLGLVKAVERFDLDRGVGFTTFAGRTIEGELKRHFRDAAWGMKVPRRTKDLRLRVRRATEDLTHRDGRPPTAGQVAQYLDVDVEEVVETLTAGAAYRPASIDTLGGDDGGQPDRLGALGRVDGNVGAVESGVAVRQLLERLPDRERRILELRFYDGLTQSEIARRVGISQMHVSRLLRRSFEDLRRHLR